MKRLRPTHFHPPLKVILTSLTILVLFLCICFYFIPPYSPSHSIGHSIHLRSPIKVATLNVRYDSPVVPLPDGEQPWSNRVDPLVDHVLFENIDIISFQEVLPNQLIDLDTRLRDRFSHVSHGRENSKKQGESDPIFFNRHKFRLISSVYYWLSETPNVKSIGWDANQLRGVTFLRLRPRYALTSSVYDIIVINTHFDDQGSLARANSAKFILQHVRDILQSTPPNNFDPRIKPLVLLFGDFNAEPQDDAYQILTNNTSNSSNKQIEQDPTSSSTIFNDAKQLMLRAPANSLRGGHLTRPFGYTNTWTDFDPPLYPELKPMLIDFILLANNDPPYQVSSFGVLSNDDIPTGIRYSDHRMLLACLDPL